MENTKNSIQSTFDKGYATMGNVDVKVHIAEHVSEEGSSGSSFLQLKGGLTILLDIIVECLYSKAYGPEQNLASIKTNIEFKNQLKASIFAEEIKDPRTRQPYTKSDLKNMGIEELKKIFVNKPLENLARDRLKALNSKSRRTNIWACKWIFFIFAIFFTIMASRALSGDYFSWPAFPSLLGVTRVSVSAWFGLAAGLSCSVCCCLYCEESDGNDLMDALSIKQYSYCRDLDGCFGVCLIYANE